ncbi:MAG TPA: TIM barrel protein [Phototrophicaceae bacterium]|nr:TIM barrel protein [Phototrophicaceae bacterium]
MAHIRQSIAWWCFIPAKLTPPELLRAAADIGYEGVDLVDQQDWPLVKAHGLKIVSIRGHESLTDGLNRRENAARIEQELRANIALAAEWQIPNLVCFSGNRNGLDDKTGAEVTAETLGKVAKTAEDAGVTLVVELLNSKVDHPDYQCDKTAWGVQVCQMVDSPAVKLLYDIYHMQIMEGDVIRTIQDNHAWFGHYHTAGNPGRNEIDDTQELNYPPIMKAIQATGFTGYVAQEFIPNGDPVASLKQAFDICNI